MPERPPLCAASREYRVSTRGWDAAQMTQELGSRRFRTAARPRPRRPQICWPMFINASSLRFGREERGFARLDALLVRHEHMDARAWPRPMTYAPDKVGSPPRAYTGHRLGRGRAAEHRAAMILRGDDHVAGPRSAHAHRGEVLPRAFTTMVRYNKKRSVLSYRLEGRSRRRQRPPQRVFAPSALRAMRGDRNGCRRFTCA